MNTVLPWWVETLVSLLLVASGIFAVLASWGLLQLKSFFKRLHPENFAFMVELLCIHFITCYIRRICCRDLHRDFTGKFLKLIRISNKIRFTFHADHSCKARDFLNEYTTIGSCPIRTFSGDGQPPFTHKFYGFIHTAFSLNKSFFTICEASTSHLTKFLNILNRNLHFNFSFIND